MGMPDRKAKNYRSVALGAPGAARQRLLAVGTGEGVSLWDLATGKEVGSLPIGHTEYVLFDGTGALLTSGPSGVRRYSVSEEPGPAEEAGRPGLLRVRIGPPELL